MDVEPKLDVMLQPVCSLFWRRYEQARGWRTLPKASTLRSTLLNAPTQRRTLLKASSAKKDAAESVNAKWDAAESVNTKKDAAESVNAKEDAAQRGNEQETTPSLQQVQDLPQSRCRAGQHHRGRKTYDYHKNLPLQDNTADVGCHCRRNMPSMPGLPEQSRKLPPASFLPPKRCRIIAAC